MKKIFFVMLLLLVFSIVCWAQSGNQSNVIQIFSNGNFIDSRIQGTWVKEGNSNLQFYFYANTWYIMENNIRVYFGTFVMNNERIACFHTIWERNNQGTYDDQFNVFEMNYVLQTNVILISNMNDSLNGRWNRVNTPQPLNLNSVVGTWRDVTTNGIYIYQFYSDGTGVFHLYDNLSGVLYRSDKCTYNSSNRTFSFNHTAHGDSYMIEGGRLIFFNNRRERVGSLERI
ncbi:MAG: hypothetical protein LBH16_03800 [Treponema sp.]|jgi:hypothetical protein|nr:hypothetical protein [Treponema sp.]